MVHNVASVSSDNLRVTGGFGAVRVLRSSYVFPPNVLRYTATAFFSGMSFAAKNKCMCAVTESVCGLNASSWPNFAVAIVI